MLIDEDPSGLMRTVTHPRRLGIPLSRWGRNLISACPFHSPEENSLFFYDALGYWRYRCLQCGSEGDLVEFVMRSRFNGLDERTARKEALEFWGSHQTNNDAEDSDEHPWVKEVGGEKARVLENFVRYCHWAACKSESSAKYLAERGWNIGQAQLYGLGYYSGDPEPFISYCMLSGIERHQISFYLDNLELYREPRITIPARNSKGVIHSVYGRTMDENFDSETYVSFASGPTDIPFNIQQDNEHPIITEGFFDALTCDLAGIPGVVSTMYQEFTQSHLYKLKACGADSITVILRRERNRRDQEFRIQKYLTLAESMNLKFKSIILPKDLTVDQIVRKNGADQLVDLIHNTEEDTMHTHRRTVLLQDIKENFDTAMSCLPDVNVGYSLAQFPKLTKAIDGVQSGYSFFSAHPFGFKTNALLSLALDLIETNPKLKLIYLALETPRRQIFDRIIAMITGETGLTVRKQSQDEAVNQKILEATKTLLGYVRDNRFEIWEDSPTLDNIGLLKELKTEQIEHPSLVVIVDGIDHLRVSDRPDIQDIHERRSSVMLDLYKALDVPMFLGGELIRSENGTITPKPYVRDADSIYWLESKGGNVFLSVDSKRFVSGQHLYEGNVFQDPKSSRMREG